VWIDAGSRYENEKNNGAAHFLEQMAFKGTKSRTQKQLEMEIGNMGGNFKSTTSREQTVYTAEVFKGDIPKAMEILSDVLQNPLLDENVMCSERSAIAHKSELALKQYTGRIFDHLHETAFMGTALGRSVIGSEQNVQSLTKGDLMSYMNANYTADRFVIAAAGAVDHRQLLELTEKHFGSLNTIPQGSLTETMEAAIFTGSDKRIRFDSMGEAHIALAFQGASWTSEYAFPLMLIQQILGSWDRTSCIGLNGSSKLTQEIAEHKLAHSYRTINTCYKDTGLFGIYLVCPDNKIEDCMWFTLDNLVRCCHTVSDQEINRAKVQLKANLLMNVDSFSGTAEDIGRQMITYGRRMTRVEVSL
jgi:processing peptidase subunit beta